MSEGRWITIGSREGADGKKHGGSPVYIENGRITKGHPGLVGRHLSKPKKPSGAHEMRVSAWEQHLKDTNTRDQYGPGPYGLKLAHREEVKHALKHGHEVPEEVLQDYPELAKHGQKVHKLAGDIQEHDAAFKADALKMLQDADKVAHQAGVDRSHEEIAKGLVGRYPHLLGGSGTPGERLEEHGRSTKPMTEAEAYEQAQEHFQGESNAVEKRQQPESRQPEHQDRNEGRQAPEAVGSDRAPEGGEGPQMLSDRAKALYEGEVPDHATVNSFLEDLRDASKDEANASLQAMGFSKQPTRSAAIAKVETLLKNRRENKARTSFETAPKEETIAKRNEVVKAQEEAAAGREAKPEKAEPKPAAPSPEQPPEPRPVEKRPGTVADHLARLQALEADFKNPDFAALKAEVAGIGASVNAEGAKQLAQGMGISGRFPNKAALMEAIRTRIANRWENYARTRFGEKTRERP